MAYKFQILIAALTSTALVAGSPGAVAQSLGSHEHGHAELNVVKLGQQLSVEFISPAMNLLGFERAPESDAEQNLFDSVAVDLLSAEWLLGDALAECEMELLSMEVPVFDAPEGGHDHDHEDEHDHDHEDDHDHDHEHGEGSGGHADYLVQYQFTCPTQPDSSFSILAFEKFAGIESITVQWVAERQQGLAELSPGRAALSLD